MFNSHFSRSVLGLGGGGAPMPAIDPHSVVVQSPVRKILAPPVVVAPTIIDKLQALPLTPETVGLLCEYDGVIKKIELFFGQNRHRVLTGLQAKRENQWKSCRAAEERLKTAVHAVAQLRGQMNTLNFEVSESRAKVAAVRGPASQFPDELEVGAWRERQAQVRSELTARERRLAETQRQTVRAAEEHDDAQQSFSAAIAALQRIENDLAQST